MAKNATIIFLALALPLLNLACGWCEPPASPFLELNKLSFFHGREYFVLRSGRTKLIVQADRADLGPAFTYLLFDAQNAAQSGRKEGSLTFDPATGWNQSALEVELGGYPFTALGHRTDTRWQTVEGVPAVEAVWWAGGIQVLERIAALQNKGVFLRTISLDAKNLAGDDNIVLRLKLPPGRMSHKNRMLLCERDGIALGLAVPGSLPLRIDEEKGRVEIGPLAISQNRPITVETYLIAGILPDEAKSFAELAKSFSDKDAAEAKSALRDYWIRVSSINTKDRTVQEIFDKAKYGLHGMVADDGTMDAGIFEYGGQWVRDSSATALGALHAGHFELARETIEHLLEKMINKEGATMIGGGFDSPDMEQFDQMGEFMHLLRNYCDWTGNDSLVRRHREKLLAMIERPLHPQFRDETGMVHNRREFWERNFNDAYELAYQTYVILGLREAAELAPALGAEDRAAYWRGEADRILKAMMSHPTHSLVQNGRLIKRRDLTGKVANDPGNFPGFLPDSPRKTEKHGRLMPDASMALPILLRVVDPRSDVARNTLDDLDQLWNARWSDGGYDRYHTSSQPDQPGPWFTTTFLLRAEHEAGNFDRSRRALEWMNTCPGGRAGAWFEEIPSNRMQMKTCGIMPWASGELAVFVVRHYLGVDFERGQMILRPALYPNSPPVSANLRFRKERLQLEIDGSGPIRSALVNGKDVKPDDEGALRLPREFNGGNVVIQTK